MLPLKIKMISTRFLLIFYNHCKKQTIKFIYCFSIWSYFAIIRILTQNIFDKTVLLLNFTILRKALTQQNCNALVTGTGLIRESCIYSMELFVYQEVDSGPIEIYNRPCRSSNKPLSKNRCAITEHHWRNSLATAHNNTLHIMSSFIAPNVFLIFIDINNRNSNRSIKMFKIWLIEIIFFFYKHTKIHISSVQ